MRIRSPQAAPPAAPVWASSGVCPRASGRSRCWAKLRCDRHPIECTAKRVAMRPKQCLRIRLPICSIENASVRPVRTVVCPCAVDDQHRRRAGDLDRVGDRAERADLARRGVVDGDPAAERVLDRREFAVHGDVVGRRAGSRTGCSTILPCFSSFSTATCMLGVPAAALVLVGRGLRCRWRSWSARRRCATTWWCASAEVDTECLAVTVAERGADVAELWRRAEDVRPRRGLWRSRASGPRRRERCRDTRGWRGGAWPADDAADALERRSAPDVLELCAAQRDEPHEPRTAQMRPRARSGRGERAGSSAPRSAGRARELNPGSRDGLSRVDAGRPQSVRRPRSTACTTVSVASVLLAAAVHVLAARSHRRRRTIAT